MTVKDFNESCERYFASLRDESGAFVRPPTVAGLCLALDMDRRSLLELTKGGRLSAPARRALMTVECWLEEEMVKRGQQGLVYALERCCDEPDDEREGIEDLLSGLYPEREF